MDPARRFFEHWQDGLVAYDRRLVVIAANATGAAMFGTDSSSIVGKTSAELLPVGAAILDDLVRGAFREGRVRVGRVEPFGPQTPVRIMARSDGEFVYLVLHRVTRDALGPTDVRERDLEFATQLLSVHTENSPLAVIRWDADFRIVEWSSRAEAMFGYRFDEVYLKTPAEVGMVYEPDRLQVERVMRDLTTSRAGDVICENRNVTKDCRVIHCRWFNTSLQLDDGDFSVLSLVEDVTESVLARAAARETEQRYRSIFEYSPDAMLSVSLEGIIVRANASASRAHGVPIDALVGRPLQELVLESHLETATTAFRTAIRGEAGGVELLAYGVNGVPYPIFASFIPIVLDGLIAGVHVVAQNRTEVKEAEHAIATHAEHIRELYLVSAAANATAERQIVATIEAGCRVLGMMSGELYDRKSDTRAANVGPPIARKLVQLPLGTDGALALDDLTHIPQLDAAGAGAFIGSPIDVGGIRYGSLCFTAPAPREKPFGAVERDLVQMMAALIGSAIERAEARTHLKHLAYNDQLTSLPNRASFIDRLRDEVSVATERSARVGVMFLDLDRFKDINDTLGHGFGDQLLRTIGDRLVAAVAPHGTVARMGGDEFIVLVAGDPDADRMTMLAERIVATVDEPVVVEGYEQYVSASIGVAMFPDDGGDADTLIKHADIAMYRAKERGRNTYAFYTPALNASLRARLAQEKSLRKALENGEFIVHYQPQIDLLSQRVVAIEALVRWQHPRLGLVSPDQFIPSAELSGLIVPLGDWILETACRQTRDLQRRGFHDLRVAVNLSARQFHQTQLVSSVREALRQTGLSPHSLELEITESVAMNDAALSVQIMQELGLAGIRLSVDDFGTGYSSLGYLRRFPLHAIKIDRSFVSDITAEPDDATIVRTVIGMAHSLGLEVIAEGVETRDQVQFLERENCDRVQGFYFAPGLPPDELEIYLARHAAIAGEVRTA